METRVLGVRIDGGSKQEIIQKMSGFLSQGGSHLVTTPNPEMLVLAHTHPYFREVLNNSDLNICDGTGVSWASGGRVTRLPGVDMMQELCVLAAGMNKTVYLVGSKKRDVLESCKNRLEKNIPGLRVVGMDTGFDLSISPEGRLLYEENDNEKVLDRIIAAAPDILFVAFGHGKQELWLYEQLPHLPSVTIGMGVGGAFDFISGDVPRAPKWMRTVGLEWVFRLVRQPWRATRIWTAVFVFSYLIVKEHFRK